MLFSRDLPDPGIKPRFPAWQAGSLPPVPIIDFTEVHQCHLHSAVAAAAAAAQSLQLCPTLCNFMGCNLPGSSVHGILQARTLEWLAISYSNK